MTNLLTTTFLSLSLFKVCLSQIIVSLPSQAESHFRFTPLPSTYEEF
jgi:hypothetical protein